MKRYVAALAVLLWLPAISVAQKLSAPGHLALYAVQGDFDTVKEDVVLAITNRGLVIDHTSHIGDMLARTGKDLGATKTVYGKAESLQFCSATISRRTMEADPANIVFCPYIIVLYTLPDDPRKVYVGYRHPQPVGSEASKASLKAVEELLDEIVKEALNIAK